MVLSRQLAYPSSDVSSDIDDAKLRTIAAVRPRTPRRVRFPFKSRDTTLGETPITLAMSVRIAPVSRLLCKQVLI